SSRPGEASVRPPDREPRPPDADDLWAAVPEVLADRVRPRRVVRLRRRPHPYQSSFPVDQVDADLDDGTTLPLILKDVSRDALTGAARRAKPEHLHDPLREAEVYRSLLPAAPPGPPAFYGAVGDPAGGRCGLLLERVAGRELFQVGEIGVWQEAAAWLARFHARFAGRTAPPAPRLLVSSPADDRAWADRAAAFAPPPLRPRFERLAARYDRVVAELWSLPPTVVHGEYYAANVLVRDAEPAEGRICPLDWETAGWGPGLLDLASLVAGKWSDADRAALAGAYFAARNAEGGGYPPAALDWCRLHVAVRWVGWSADWTPPPDHAHDWAAEALALADGLGL
ncbi:MAG TPA: aminoglycoside phosphotransferase family protein, partial [Urbifossiella sp.]|nr:aminoglycoside phosphotransferase family protein [Urbifossiella sp.]